MVPHVETTFKHERLAGDLVVLQGREEVVRAGEAQPGGEEVIEQAPALMRRCGERFYLADVQTPLLLFHPHVQASEMAASGCSQRGKGARNTDQRRLSEAGDTADLSNSQGEACWENKERQEQ